MMFTNKINQRILLTKTQNGVAAVVTKILLSGKNRDVLAFQVETKARPRYFWHNLSSGGQLNFYHNVIRSEKSQTLADTDGFSTKENLKLKVIEDGSRFLT